VKGLGGIPLWTSELKFGFKCNYKLFQHLSLLKEVLILVLFTNCLTLASLKASIRKGGRRNTSRIWGHSKSTYRRPCRYADQERLSGRTARDVLVPETRL
jgi:hypothetical protein